MKMLQKNQPCPSCGRSDNRGISVDMVAVRDGKILLYKRAKEPYKGWWGIFGGFIDWDETPENAVDRETREETGLVVTSKKLIGVYGDPKRHPRQVITLTYAIETKGDPIVGDEAEDVRWFSLDELPEKLGFDHAKIIQDY